MQSSDREAIKIVILKTADDLMLRFLETDRKNDEELPVGAIDEALDAGWVTIDEILDVFRKALEDAERDW